MYSSERQAKLKLLKPHIDNAKQWFEDEGLHLLTFEDVVIFRIGSSIGPVKMYDEDKLADDADVRQIVERDFVVDFMKITKKDGDTVMGYSYKQLYKYRPLIVDGEPLLVNLQGKCTYMPHNYTLPANDIHNPYTTKMVLDREKAGKYVCDQLDAKVRVLDVRNDKYFPRMEYFRGYNGEGEVVTEKRNISWNTYDVVDDKLGTISAGRKHIPNDVIIAMSALAVIGHKSWKYSRHHVNQSNGVVVTPVSAIYNQIVNTVDLISSWG